MNRNCVWVLEVGVLHATRNKISKWEVWQAFNVLIMEMEKND